MVIAISLAEILPFSFCSMHAWKVDAWSLAKDNHSFQTGILKNVSQHDWTFFLKKKICTKPIKHAQDSFYWWTQGQKSWISMLEQFIVIVSSKFAKAFQFYSDTVYIKVFVHFHSKTFNTDWQTVNSTLQAIVYFVLSAADTNNFSLQFSFKFPPYIVFAKSHKSQLHCKSDVSPGKETKSIILSTIPPLIKKYLTTIGKSLMSFLLQASKLSVTLFASCKSSITSVITCGANTLLIVACDLLRAEENLGSIVFFISLNKQSLARKLWPWSTPW